jgi:hypothetical protein
LEVEIVLSERISLRDVSDLPRAPGSDLAVSEDSERVVVQLPARQVEDLVSKGANISVLRRFILVEGFNDEALGAGGSATPKSICMGSYCEDSNDTDVPIEDGTGNWAVSVILVSGAPGGSQTISVDVH